MKRLVLAGAGHAHAQVLKALARNNISECDVVLVSPTVMAPYSGMIPGWLAGYYSWPECCVDFAHLCRRAGATMCLDAVASVDSVRSEIRLESGATIGYDWLSIDVGSTLSRPSGGGIDILPMRPLGELKSRWEKLLRAISERKPGTNCRIVMVGGGAAGVESVLAAYWALTQVAPDVRFSFTLATQGKGIFPGMTAGVVRRIGQHLDSCGISVANDFLAAHIENDAVVSLDGRRLPADVVLWATGARAYPWMAASGLSVDENGFIRVDRNLRVQSQPNIFAAGDCAGLVPPLPKAGVFAVRMGTVLAHNLLAVIQGRPLRRYVPQRHYLTLIGTGDANAVAIWGRFCWEGVWVWRWKQFIDRRFVALCNET